MRRTFRIALNQLKIEFSNKGRTIVWIGLPILFTVIFGGLISNSGSGQFAIAIKDLDRSSTSHSIIEQLDREKSLVVQMVDGKEMNELFVHKRVSIGLTIPKGFQAALDDGKAPKVTLVTLPTGAGNLDALAEPTINKAISRAASDYRIAKEYAKDSGTSIPAALKKVADTRKSSSVSVETTEAKKETDGAGNSNVGATSLGFIVMFMMYMVFNMGGVILREREGRTWGRLLSTPAKKVEVMCGYMLSFVFTGLTQFTILIALSTLLFHIKWGPLVPMYAIAIALTLSGAGLGLFLAGLVRTTDQQNSIGTIFVTATSMLGGTFWPLDFVPPIMRKIAYFTPQAWAMDGFRDVLLKNATLTDVLLPVGVLAAFAAIFLTAGVMRVRYE